MYKIAYFPGCSLKGTSALYDIQVRMVLRALGIEAVELKNWNCCGATSVAKEDHIMAVSFAARNLGIAEKTGLDKMVIPCSGCYSRMILGQNVLKNNSGLRSEINESLSAPVTNDIKILNLIELILPFASDGTIKSMVARNLSGLKVACYYGCMQTRFPSSFSSVADPENPHGMENILAAAGATPIDWGYKTDCCGASASVNDTDTSLRLMSHIMKDAVARGADCFVTTCPFCHLNLDAYQDTFCKKYKIKPRLPVYLITELLGVSFGLDIKKLQIDRHFIDAVTPLWEQEIIE